MIQSVQCTRMVLPGDNMSCCTPGSRHGLLPPVEICLHHHSWFKIKLIWSDQNHQRAIPVIFDVLLAGLRQKLSTLFHNDFRFGGGTCLIIMQNGWLIFGFRHTIFSKCVYRNAEKLNKRVNISDRRRSIVEMQCVTNTWN